MFNTIKITEPVSNKTFKGSGFFRVVLESEKQDDLVYFNNMTEMYTFLEPWENVSTYVKELFNKPEVEEIPPITVIEDNSRKVSEDFALKVLAITMNKEKFKDINQ